MIFASVLLFSSCNFDWDYNPDLDGFTQIGSGTIGPEGGDIILDDITVLVPAGATREKATINIYIDTVSANNPFGEEGITPVFMIDKLPEVLLKPITVKIPWEGDIFGDTLMAVGIESFALSLDSTLFTYETQNSRYENGYLICDLFEDMFKTKSSGEEINYDFGVTIAGLNNYSHFPESDFVELSIPNKYIGYSQTIIDHFASAKDTYEKMGFDYFARPKPVKVLVISKLNYSGSYGWLMNAGYLDAQIWNYMHHGKFELSADILHKDKFLKSTVYHEMMHLTEHLYEFSGLTFSPAQNWLFEAAAVWSEGLVYTDQDYASHNISKPNYAFFDGLAQKPFPHGYNMSFMCYGLEYYYGPIMVDIFEEIRDGIPVADCVTPVEAIENLVEDPIELIWFNVLNDYLQGKYQGGQDAKIIWGEYLKKTGAFVFDNENDTIAYQQGGDYYNLSAQIYFFDFNNLEFTDQYQLDLSLPDNQMNGLGVYTFNDEDGAILMGTIQPGSNAKYVVNNLKLIKESGQYIACLLTIGDHSEDYMSHTSVDLNYKMTKTKKFSPDDLTGTFAGTVSFEELSGSFDYTNKKCTLQINIGHGIQFESEFQLSASVRVFEDDGTPVIGGQNIGPFENGESIDWWFGDEHKIGEMTATPETNSGWYIYERLNDSGKPYHWAKSTWNVKRVN